jgi:hypothetical protein
MGFAGYGRLDAWWAVVDRVEAAGRFHDHQGFAAPVPARVIIMTGRANMVVLDPFCEGVSELNRLSGAGGEPRIRQPRQALFPRRAAERQWRGRCLQAAAP